MFPLKSVSLQQLVSRAKFREIFFLSKIHHASKTSKNHTDQQYEDYQAELQQKEDLWRQSEEVVAEERASKEQLARQLAVQKQKEEDFTKKMAAMEAPLAQLQGKSQTFPSPSPPIASNSNHVSSQRLYHAVITYPPKGPNQIFSTLSLLIFSNSTNFRIHH